MMATFQLYAQILKKHCLPRRLLLADVAAAAATTTGLDPAAPPPARTATMTAASPSAAANALSGSTAAAPPLAPPLAPHPAAVLARRGGLVAPWLALALVIVLVAWAVALSRRVTALETHVAALQGRAQPL